MEGLHLSRNACILSYQYFTEIDKWKWVDHKDNWERLLMSIIALSAAEWAS